MKLGATPLNGVPSDKVPLIVPLPVTVRVNVADDPLQIVVLPLSAAVGLALIDTIALPVLSAAIAVQLSSLNVAIV